MLSKHKSIRIETLAVMFFISALFLLSDNASAGTCGHLEQEYQLLQRNYDLSLSRFASDVLATGQNAGPDSSHQIQLIRLATQVEQLRVRGERAGCPQAFRPLRPDPMAELRSRAFIYLRECEDPFPETAESKTFQDWFLELVTDAENNRLSCLNAFEQSIKEIIKAEEEPDDPDRQLKALSQSRALGLPDSFAHHQIKRLALNRKLQEKPMWIKMWAQSSIRTKDQYEMRLALEAVRRYSQRTGSGLLAHTEAELLFRLGEEEESLRVLRLSDPGSLTDPVKQHSQIHLLLQAGEIEEAAIEALSGMEGLSLEERLAFFFLTNGDSRFRPSSLAGDLPVHIICKAGTKGGS